LQTNYEETQDEAQRIRLPGPGVSPQEDPQQQLPDATQLRSYMHHASVPASDHFTRTCSPQGRDSAPGRLVQCFSTSVRPRPGKLFFYKTRARSKQIYW